MSSRGVGDGHEMIAPRASSSMVVVESAVDVEGNITHHVSLHKAFIFASGSNRDSTKHEKSLLI